ncbi:DUF4435 domain-containing protein [Pseudomonas bubulae]|uniref:DUF4435 domain-containing protein n=1 Tax=Pseudomonas bubulae TaxID=2316085 RepID=UPI003CFBD57C
MARNQGALPSVDELIALLKKTNLPTLIVEGKDDLIIYKRLENQFYKEDLSVLPVGGRENVLRIFKRVNELPPHCKIMFIADKDNWVITGIPGDYHSDRLFFTAGYSIENDVFQDVNVDAYMSGIEKQRFESELERFLAWYALALSRNIDEGDEAIKNHPNHILDNQQEFEHLTLLKDGEVFPQGRFEALSADYKNLLRGKSLMQLAMRQLSYNGRPARHTDKSFIEHAAINPGPLISQLIGHVEVALAR